MTDFEKIRAILDNRKMDYEVGRDRFHNMRITFFSDTYLLFNESGVLIKIGTIE